MVRPPVIARPKLPAKLRQPGLVFYRVPVLDALKRGDREQLQIILKNAKELRAEFGDFDKLIDTLETAAKRAQ
jgi:hypothetical protein